MFVNKIEDKSLQFDHLKSIKGRDSFMYSEDMFYKFRPFHGDCLVAWTKPQFFFITPFDSYHIEYTIGMFNFHCP